MLIRTVKESDLSAWVEMRTLLWPDDKESHRRELIAYFEGQSPDIVEAFVLETSDGVLAGFMELNIRDFAEGSRLPKVPYVEAWFVSAHCRGKGYGKWLLQHAEAWALEQGFTELASDTDVENTRSIAIHKHLGYTETERIVCFLKPLNARQ